jgi:hypothetical protein
MEKEEKHLVIIAGCATKFFPISLQNCLGITLHLQNNYIRFYM